MSKRSNEDALELFADLLEPAAEILSDPEVGELAKSGTLAKAISTAIKNHKKAVIEILARIDGVDPKDYKVNVVALPVRLMELLNKPEIQDFFTSQGQKSAAESFGSATANTEDGVN